MSEEISEDIEAGKNVIVGGDFNETCEEDGLMSKTMEKTGLINYFKRRMGVVPPTRRPGKRAIDHVWVTPGAFSAVNRAGIVGQEEVFLSDHVGLFLDLKIGDLGTEEDHDPR